MDKIAVQKELMKGSAVARFSHYRLGYLYYRVTISGAEYEFPIATLEGIFTGLRLSEDLGETPFPAEEKAALLFRWISKAIDAGTLRRL